MGVVDFEQAPAAADEQPRLRRSNENYKRRREAILNAATELFLAAGYEIKMDEVAARAGVSKKTLYAHFGTKLSLFEAVVRRNSASFIAATELRRERDLTALLSHYADQFQLHSFTPEGLQLHKLMVAEVSKHPDLAQATYTAGIDMVVSELTRQLAAIADSGAIVVDDPRDLAEQFVGALSGLLRHRAYCGLGIDSGEKRRAYINSVIKLFVRGAMPPVGRDCASSPEQGS